MSNLPESPHSPPQRQHNAPTPTSRFSTPKQTAHPKSPGMRNSIAPFVRLLSNDPLLLEPRRTHPFVWCIAIICLVFCLLIIFFGISTLILFLVIKPKYPAFDVPNANFNAIYFHSPDNFNGDFTLLANFTNPNRKINIRYDYLVLKLYFVDSLIAAQVLKSFSQRPGEARLEMIHLTSNLVHLPPSPAVELQRQVLNNRVKYDIKGSFKVRAKVGVARFSYWLHAWCQVEMTSPPTGVLVARNCSTKR